MKIITYTERLYLREFTPEDAIHFYKMNLDQEVLKYTGDLPFKSEKEAKTFLINYKQYAKHNMGRWAVCNKDTHAFLGWCGLKYHPDRSNSAPFVEVGYRFYKKFWNNGYATESAKAAIHYGFNTLNLNTIYAHVHIDNINSHKVINKCGLQLVHQANYDGMPAFLYKIEVPKIEVKQIKASETHAVRHPVLRANKPIETCVFPEDLLKSTVHLGLYLNSKLIGVATFINNKNKLFKAETQYQLRGMAILKTGQRKGYGNKLIHHGEQLLKLKKENTLIWFNARETAVAFYEKNQYTCIGKPFEIPEVGIHFVMYKNIAS